jgi:hypothetical protein
MMKNLLTVAFFCCLALSCQQAKLINESQAGDVIGKWRMYETVNFQNNDDSVAAKCNTCPEVEFSKNHSGFIKKSGQGVFYFTWQTDNDRLSISHNDNSKTDSTIEDGNYQLTLFNNMPIKELELLDTVKSLKYVLSK